jgi:hypothetical protein
VKTESIQSGLIGLSEPDNLCFVFVNHGLQFHQLT